MQGAETGLGLGMIVTNADDGGRGHDDDRHHQQHRGKQAHREDELDLDEEHELLELKAKQLAEQQLVDSYYDEGGELEDDDEDLLGPQAIHE